MRGRPPSGKTKKSKEAVERLSSDGGALPVEIMVKSMRKLYAQYQECEDYAELNNSIKEKEEVLKQGLGYLQEACEIAKNVAPYFHPKLQSMTVVGDEDGPPVLFELTGVDELRKAIRGAVIPPTPKKE